MKTWFRKIVYWFNKNILKIVNTKTNMDKSFQIPPQSSALAMSADKLIERLKPLLGKPFHLSGKPRTDGSSLRKLIANTLQTSGIAPEADKDSFEFVPPKKKGVPKLIREMVDTYIVITGDSYNLQVWNRYPNSRSVLVKYISGETIQSKDIRLVFIKIDTEKEIINSIVILTPEYIENKFGKFGKPTIKHQLLISQKQREKIINSENSILLYPDTKNLTYRVRHTYENTPDTMLKEPDFQNLFSTKLLSEMVAKKLIGQKLEANDTKNRGQALERLVLQLLGYSEDNLQGLAGGYPDIPNQILEVKVQDKQTVDLGKYTPEIEEVVIEDSNVTTSDIRYLIALTNPMTGIIEGIVLSPGEKLGEIFTYVSDTSFKCQRSIPMSFFDKYKGLCVFNP
jgi:hypothetical protein